MLQKPNFSVLSELEIQLISLSRLVISSRKPTRQNEKVSGRYLSNSQETVIRNLQRKLFPVILINIGLWKYIIIRERLDSAIGIKYMMKCLKTTSTTKILLFSNVGYFADQNTVDFPNQKKGCRSFKHQILANPVTRNSLFGNVIDGAVKIRHSLNGSYLYTMYSFSTAHNF
ncbi:Protein SWT21 [Dirofilaria immitis]